MNEITKRIIFGLLYIFVIVIATNSNNYFFSVIFYVFMMFCTYELNRILKIKSKIPYFLNSIIFISFVIRDLNLEYYFINPRYNLFKISVLILILFLTIPLINLVFSKNSKPLNIVSNTYLSFIYIGLPFSLIFDIKTYILTIFILLWTNDTFAYLIGKNFGKTKLIEHISPKKTIEGYIGGLIFTLIAGYIISFINTNLTVIYWLIIALIVNIFGTLGDLIESKFKREANIKDSSNLIPGHGGFLDRLDSFIFAIPFIFIFLNLYFNVS